jgi:hypothetical protein
MYAETLCTLSLEISSFTLKYTVNVCQNYKGAVYAFCMLNTTIAPMSVAARCNACVCGRSLAGTASWIPPVSWICFCCECCVLSCRGLCVGLITRPEEFYRLWCVWVWSWIFDNEETLAHWGLLCHGSAAFVLQGTWVRTLGIGRHVWLGWVLCVLIVQVSIPIPPGSDVYKEHPDSITTSWLHVIPSNIILG